MPVESVFEEDHLTPIASMNGELWFFSRLDRQIYRGSPHYSPVEFTTPDGTFLVPGDNALLTLSVAGHELLVDRRELGTLRTGVPVRVRYRAAVTENHRICGVVSGALNTRHAVLTEDGANFVLVELSSGARRTVRAPHGSIVRAVLTDGVLVDLGDSHAVVRDRRLLWSPGRIVDVSRNADQFLIRGLGGESRFHIVDCNTRTPLQLPDGWSPIQSMFSDDMVIASCLHPDKGYGIYSDGQVYSRDGLVQLFPSGGRLSVMRETGVSIGSRWRGEAGDRRGRAEPRPDLHVRSFLYETVPIVLFSGSASRRRLLVALHGGPDSHEWDDLRYGGTYRNILDQSDDIAVVNYPGSAGFGHFFQAEAWQRWDKALATTASAIRKLTALHGYDEIRILGVSFGAWLALQLADKIAARAVILVSPVIALQSHVSSHFDDGPAFANWAMTRFGQRGASHGDHRSRLCSSPVSCVVPDDDEVVRACDSTTVANDLGWNVHTVPGRHYPTTANDARVRWTSILRALREV